MWTSIRRASRIAHHLAPRPVVNFAYNLALDLVEAPQRWREDAQPAPWRSLHNVGGGGFHHLGRIYADWITRAIALQPGFVVLLYILGSREWRILQDVVLGRGIVVAICIFWPWYHGMVMRYGRSFWNELFGTEQLRRLTEQRQQPAFLAAGRGHLVHDAAGRAHHEVLHLLAEQGQLARDYRDAVSRDG